MSRDCEIPSILRLSDGRDAVLVTRHLSNPEQIQFNLIIPSSSIAYEGSLSSAELIKFAEGMRIDLTAYVKQIKAALSGEDQTAGYIYDIKDGVFQFKIIKDDIAGIVGKVAITPLDFAFSLLATFRSCINKCKGLSTLLGDVKLENQLLFNSRNKAIEEAEVISNSVQTQIDSVIDRAVILINEKKSRIRQLEGCGYSANVSGFVQPKDVPQPKRSHHHNKKDTAASKPSTSKKVPSAVALPVGRNGRKPSQKRASAINFPSSSDSDTDDEGPTNCKQSSKPSCPEKLKNVMHPLTSTQASPDSNINLTSGFDKAESLSPLCDWSPAILPMRYPIRGEALEMASSDSAGSSPILHASSPSADATPMECNDNQDDSSDDDIFASIHKNLFGQHNK